jgi:Glutathione S-transferase
VILWGRPSSVNVQKVLWALTEYGRPFEHRVVGGRHGGLDDPAFRRLTPAGKVPVLEVGGTGIWESHAILRHLARDQPEHPLSRTLPASDPWMDFAASSLMPPFIGLFWQRVRLRPEERSGARQAELEVELSACLSVLDRGLAESSWLGGEDFGLGDIAAGTVMYRLFDISPNLFRAAPVVDAWRVRLSARRGWQRFVATSYDELRPD